MISYVEKSDVSLDNDEIKINIVEQSSLIPSKWSLYLRAPHIFNTIKNKKVKPFNKLQGSYTESRQDTIDISY
jgi:hypothetical protein